MQFSDTLFSFKKSRYRKYLDILIIIIELRFWKAPLVLKWFIRSTITTFILYKVNIRYGSLLNGTRYNWTCYQEKWYVTINATENWQPSKITILRMVVLDIDTLKIGYYEGFKHQPSWIMIRHVPVPVLTNSGFNFWLEIGGFDRTWNLNWLEPVGTGAGIDIWSFYQ